MIPSHRGTRRGTPSFGNNLRKRRVTRLHVYTVTQLIGKTRWSASTVELSGVLQRGASRILKDTNELYSPRNPHDA